MNQLSPEEKDVARAVLEGLLIKHVPRKWASPSAATASAPGAVAARKALPGKAAPTVKPASKRAAARA